MQDDEQRVRLARVGATGRSAHVTARRYPDLRYFVNWRPYLWARPVARALAFLGDLRDKRVLEIGGGDGRLSSLFALLGANVTLADLRLRPQATEEIRKWGVEHRVRLVQTNSTLEELGTETFDVVFTKSVLWCVQDLAGLLHRIDAHLALRGKVAFVENYRGGSILFWVRRHLVHRRSFPQGSHYFGIRADQIPLFQECFADVTVRRPHLLVYEIFGQKKLREAAEESS